LRKAALQSERGKLGRELDDQYRISETAECLCAVDSAGDEQKRQARSQPDAES